VVDLLTLNLGENDEPSKKKIRATSTSPDHSEDCLCFDKKLRQLRKRESGSNAALLHAIITHQHSVVKHISEDTMTETDRKHIALWLFACCVMVFIIVWVGGITRLTESGLSIVEWKPFAGTLPPLGDAAWQEEFAKYQQSPEYKQVNSGMSLAEFKGIFALEYLHRLLARLTGLVFLLPFLYFAFTRKLSRSLLARFSVIFMLGGVQGAIGWFMVKSGLQHDPAVSQYRLALHLGTGFLIYGLLLWNGLSLWRSSSPERGKERALAIMLPILLFLIFLQVLSGAFVAKLHAGLIYNTFPLMDGRFIPSGLFPLSPWYKSFFEDVTTVQFTHRMIAYSITIVTLVLFIVSRTFHDKKSIKTSVNLVTIMVLVQVSLGIATLVNAVPIALASMHQVGALLLFSLGLNSLHTIYYTRK
jgi:heme a synthase